MANDLDNKTFTQSDFCVIGTNMEFTDYGEDAMHNAIKNYFHEAYGIADIEYINPAFDITLYFEVMEKYNFYKGKKGVIDAWCKKHGYTDAEYKALAQSDTRESDFPMEAGKGLSLIHI